MLKEQQLGLGDVLLLYTNGMTESFNDSGEEFGEPRLIEALQRHRGASAQTLIASLLDEIRQFNPREQQDGITLIIAKVRDDLSAL